MFNTKKLTIGKKTIEPPVYESVSRQNRFETLVKAYSNDLYRFAYWLCSNHSIADDLVQETFLRAWKALDKLEDEKKAKSWLITILRRENARRFERKRLDLVNIEDVVVEDKVNLSPDQSIETQQLHQAILNLDIDYREPLLLQTIGGYKTSEIAQLLKLNLNTVNTRLFRARDQLKRQLSKDRLPIHRITT
ncbi:MAG: sigma-70 family RNA polymerase sigma factor [gamma proteobacterium symbiont of Bathyaustriella thionipta]|nr:sigma-70 family RNA polymerase sigma factor [gamma proteobacterium symbiont of Bathyaustriella thionipta]MCU7950079.1 sigma-70 family RNA polymerase sigma factor [gamma proteobacterium symbiont of Bathyaustriella thionipta]MCU7953929.1 sigma-70 family RNA polymerase sigma factor [gamma proteobacterium symbiont of Bathyaustriella thionipta]MCU7956664.1 sigma-70 family RNA polymerase sigma factor [gamma proteobacterium symbiont of Bathyaustriella thionipta]MCU7967872.1 sigma-70 family RNA poly